jgi:IS5 family transposase
MDRDRCVRPSRATHAWRKEACFSLASNRIRLAKRHGLTLRQTYARVAKYTLVKHQRYAHAKQFKRAKRSLKTLKTCLGRVIRDITRKIADNPALQEIFATPLMLTRRVHAQNKNLRPVKGAPEGADLRIFSLHAPGRMYRERQGKPAL